MSTALQALHGASDRFLVIPGEEVTDKFGDAPLHINGLNVEHAGRTAGRNVGRGRPAAERRCHSRRGGVPHINHPNFRWAMTPAELGAGAEHPLFEIFNGHPEINMFGGGGVPGLEEAWDTILTNGTLIHGIAVDDAHIFKQPGNPTSPGPAAGGSWSAPNGSTARCMQALDRGDFYASTGVELADYVRDPRSMTVTVTPTTFSKYRIQFIGRGGTAVEGIGGHDRHLRVHGPRRLRPRQGHREQRAGRVGAAGDGRVGIVARCVRFWRSGAGTI